MLDQMQITLPVEEQAAAQDSKASGESQQTPDLFSTYQEIQVQRMCFVVHPMLAQGYQTACREYHRMEEECEYGPYLFLTGYEYAHLARKHAPAGLTRMEKHEWHCGFLAGWTACMFLIDR